MEFKRTAARWKREIEDLEIDMLESVKDGLHSDDPNVRSSFMFKKFEELHQERHEIKDARQLADEEMSLTRAGLTIFLGGVETTRNTVETFILAMSLFPNAQKQAQVEIDQVIGSGRLPTLEDLPNLPYMQAVVLETLRWSPTATFGT
ncbi:hypothetical protein FRB90_003647 [Tulasnella sp. 427]|nr:hypothetical protein FRB90_003647 [Tulasnella sp. 427]